SSRAPGQRRQCIALRPPPPVQVEVVCPARILPCSLSASRSALAVVHCLVRTPRTSHRSPLPSVHIDCATARPACSGTLPATRSSTLPRCRLPAPDCCTAPPPPHAEIPAAWRAQNAPS